MTDNQTPDTGREPTPPDLRWCQRCEEYVIPRHPDKACSKCGRFIPGSLGVTKGATAANPDRVQVLAAQFERDYGPFDSTIDAHRCMSLAAICERMERWESAVTGKIDSLPYKNLSERREALARELNASRDARIPPAERIAEVRRVVVYPDGWQPRASSDVPSDVRSDVPSDIIPSEPAAPECCAYCHQPLTRCAEIRETRIDDWRALHWNDPEEIKRRADLAGAEMMESLRRARGGGW